MHLFDIIHCSLLLIGFGVGIFTVLWQLKPLRIKHFYDNIITTESNIKNENKDIWGIDSNNEITLTDGSKFKVDLVKLSSMVVFLDTYCSNRSLKRKGKRPKVYSQYSMIYKMFESKIYRDYWKNIVLDRFYNNEPKKNSWIQRILKISPKRNYDSKFVTAIENTIKNIEQSLNKFN